MLKIVEDSRDQLILVIYLRQFQLLEGPFIERSSSGNAIIAISPNNQGAILVHELFFGVTLSLRRQNVDLLI